jgi:hypothetical protein
VGARLHPDTRRLLSRYSGGPLSPALRAALLSDLNARLLPDPALPRLVRAGAAELVASLDVTGDGAELESLLARVAELPTPYGLNVQRVNRRILERLFPYHERRRPWGFLSRSFPSTEEVRAALVREFNLLLQDPGLHTPERFPDAPVEAIRSRHRGRLDWVNRILLEIGFAGAIEPSHSPYRDRMRGLIAVLRRGASTRQGIVDIVAANLGIIGDDPEVRRAREMIRIVEYLPRHATFFAGEVGFWQEFEVRNPNATASEPEVAFTILPGPYAYLTNVRITDRDTGAGAHWSGSVRAGDRLVMRGTEVLVNGIPPTIPLTGSVPSLPGGSADAPGRARWLLDAEVLLMGNEPGEERGYPVARFDRSVGASLGTFDTTVLGRDEPIVLLEVSSYHFTPGVFSVRIPWHIAGFTDKFEEQDHPRQQIRSLVHRVKAAGVQAHVAYWQLFAEAHELSDALSFGLGGRGMSDDQGPTVGFRADLQQNPSEPHDSESSLGLEARLEYTRFDSLNTLD